MEGGGINGAMHSILSLKQVLGRLALHTCSNKEYKGCAKMK